MRLVFLLQFMQDPFFHLHISDSFLYSSLAGLIRGGGLPSTAHFMSPAYPYLIAGLQALTGDADFWVRLLQCVAGSVTVVLVYVIARRMTTERAAIIAAVSVAVHAPLVFYDNMILIESWLTLAFTTGVASFLAWIRTQRMAHLVMCGLALGIAAVLRGSMLVFVPLASVSVFVLAQRTPNRLGKALAPAAVALLCILPWTIRNYAVEGVWIPVTSSAGFNFYAGNNAESRGTYTVPEEIDLRIDPNGGSHAERIMGRKLNSAEVSDFWMKKAFSWIGDRPSDALLLLGKKLLLFFHLDEVEQQGLGLAFIRHTHPGVLSVLPSLFPVILPLAVAGVFILRIRHTPVAFTLAIVGVYVCLTVIFFVNARFRLPVLPLIAAFAGAALDGILTAFAARTWRSLVVPFLAGAGALVLLVTIQQDHRDSFQTEYTALGQQAFDHRDYPAAERHFSAAVSASSTARTLVNLGNAIAAQGRFDEALSTYRAALAADSSYALAHFNMGNLLAQRGDLSSAIRSWLKTIVLNRGFAPAHRNLAIALYAAGNLQDALRSFMVYQRLESDAVKRQEVNEDMRTIRRLLGMPSGVR